MNHTRSSLLSEHKPPREGGKVVQSSPTLAGKVFLKPRRQLNRLTYIRKKYLVSGFFY